MHKKLALSGVVAIFLSVTAPVYSETLTAEAITGIFAGNTVAGYHHKKDFAFKRSYSPDGKLTGVSERRGKRTGDWKAETNAICIKWEFDRFKCRRIEKDGDTVKQSDKSGNRHTATYKVFTAGNNLKKRGW